MICRLRWYGRNRNQIRIPIWRTFGRIPWHVIPEPPATLQGAATWRIRCHDPRATSHIAGCCRRANSTACPPRATYVSHCRVLPLGEFTVMIPEPHATCHIPGYTIAGCNNSIRHIENRFRHILFIFLFLNAVCALTSGGFRIVSDTFVISNSLDYRDD